MTPAIDLCETWSPAALELIRRRYTDGDASEDAPERWLQRVAREICQLYNEPQRGDRIESYTALMRSRRFLPTSAVLANAGRTDNGLAGCCVLPLGAEPREHLVTALPRIYDTLIAGTGVGLDATPIPPRLMSIGTAGLLSPGPVEVLYYLVRAAALAIRYRCVKPAAFMGSMLVDHPDIFELIAAKTREPLPWINLSVAVDGAFREALARDGWLSLHWQRGEERVPFTEADLARLAATAAARGFRPPDLQLGRDREVSSATAGVVVGRVTDGLVSIRAHAVLDAMAACAYASGDPGLLNLEMINALNPTHSRFTGGKSDAPGIGVIRTTAPCGEKPLLSDEACFLGSINLAAFVPNGVFDFQGLAETADLAVRFLDDVIDVSEARGTLAAGARANRKIGLGMMGLADTLSALDVPYDSEQGRDFGARMAATIHAAAIDASKALAREKGAFPNWCRSRFANRDAPRRHATVTSVAPTGHISRLADCSPSIEPHFRLFETRYDRLVWVHPLLERRLAALDFSLERWIARSDVQCLSAGSLACLADHPTGSPDRDRRLCRLKSTFPTALDLDSAAHLGMAARLQDFVESAISKTINLPSDKSVNDVRRVFEQALATQLRGITVYRAGSLRCAPCDT